MANTVNSKTGKISHGFLDPQANGPFSHANLNKNTFYKPVVDASKPIKDMDYLKTSKYKKLKKFLIGKFSIDPTHVIKVIKALQKHNKILKSSNINKNKYEEKTNINKQLSNANDFFILTFHAPLGMFEPSKQIISVPLKYSIYAEKYGSKICIISDSNIHTKINELNFQCKAEIISVNNLKKDLLENEDMNKFVKSYDLIFIDDNISKMIPPKLLSRIRKLKRPLIYLKISLYKEKEILSFIIEKLNNTYFERNNLQSCSLIVSRLSQKISESTYNIIDGIFKVLPLLLRDKIKPSNIEKITLKTYNSIEIPIYKSDNKE